MNPISLSNTCRVNFSWSQNKQNVATVFSKFVDIVDTDGIVVRCFPISMTRRYCSWVVVCGLKVQGVASSNLTRVTVKRLSLRETTGNHLIKPTCPDKTHSLVYVYCWARNRICHSAFFLFSKWSETFASFRRLSELCFYINLQSSHISNHWIEQRILFPWLLLYDPHESTSMELVLSLWIPALLLFDV